jgi:hypothetical protein
LPGLSEFPQRLGNSIANKWRSIKAGEGERTTVSAELDSGISRRRFLISTSMAAAVGVLAPVAAKPTAAPDAKWGNGSRSPKDFIGDVFQGD